jgi:hypothetical protein
MKRAAIAAWIAAATTVQPAIAANEADSPDVVDA